MIKITSYRDRERRTEKEKKILIKFFRQKLNTLF